MTEKQTIAEKIRAIRKACGFTQQQVAAVLNVDRSTPTPITKPAKPRRIFTP